MIKYFRLLTWMHYLFANRRWEHRADSGRVHRGSREGVAPGSTDAELCLELVQTGVRVHWLPTHWARTARALLLCGCFSSCAVPTGYVPTGFVPDSELKVTQYVNKGVYDFLRSRYDLAEESFVIAGSLRPESPTIIHNLALTYFRLGAFPEAEAAWKGLIARRPDDPNLYFELGNYFVGRKQYAEAIQNFEKALRKRQAIDKGAIGKSPDEISKESLSIKTIPVTVPPIIASLSEVSWRAGFRNEAICYAARASLQEGALPTASLMPVITSVRVLTNLGITDLSLEIVRQKIPEVMQSRSAAISHALALVYFAKNDQDNFIKSELSAMESFNLNEDVKAEITLIRKLLKEPYDVQVGSSDEDTTAFWPPELKELTISSNWDEDTVRAMKTLSRRFEEELLNAGLEEEDSSWFDLSWIDFSWLTSLRALFSES